MKQYQEFKKRGFFQKNSTLTDDLPPFQLIKGVKGWMLVEEEEKG